MNRLRIIVNSAFAFLCALAGMYLLFQDTFFLRNRWHSETGTLFSGISLYLLAFGLFFFAAFAAVVALAWIRGVLPMPNQREIRPHPTYKGQIIARYWYLVIPASTLVLGALLLGKNISNPALSLMPQHDVTRDQAVVFWLLPMPPDRVGLS